MVVTNRILILLIAGFAVILTVSIIATYFGKKCTKCDESNPKLPDICQKYACNNTSVLDQWINTCRPSGPTTTTVRPSSGGQSGTTSGNPVTGSTAPPLEYRLPGDMSPSLYELTVKPYYKADAQPSKFDGKIRIHFTCVRNTNKLILHMKNIELVNSTLMLSSTTDPALTSPLTAFPWTFNRITEILTFEFASSGGNTFFKQGNDYVLSLDYIGLLQADNVGFYRTSYVNSQGQTRYVIASQMEPVDARKAFPCFDEPGYKAKFQIKVIHDNSVIATSNMPVTKITQLVPSDGYNWQETEFAESPRMTTYLVALVVSDFVCKYGVAKPALSQSVNISVCGRTSAADQLDYSVDISIRALETLESLYQVAYPLGKSDQYGVPSFNFGAMENWGLVIYIESALFKSNFTTRAQEQQIVRIIVHELVHQWFGNLVTMKWWNDLFLNEGFARYYEYHGAHLLKPEWDQKSLYVELFLSLMQTVSVEETKAITAPNINSPAEIMSTIDGTITYGKGSCIVRTLNYMLGEDFFYKALKHHFTVNQYTSVDQNQFWDTIYNFARSENKLQELSNLRDAMTTWTVQKGLPLVTVNRLNQTHFSIRQVRFLLDPIAQDDLINDPYKWYIPFSFSVETVGNANGIASQANINNVHDKMVWLRPDETEKIISFGSSIDMNNQFIAANLDAGAFFRVNYDLENWKLIGRQLKMNKNAFTPNMRAQLISDAFAVSQATRQDASVPLDIIQYLATERDYQALNIFFARVRYYTNLLDSSSFYGDMASYFRSLVKPTYDRLTWFEKDSDTWLEKFMRQNVIDFACKYDLPSCIEQSQTYYKQFMASPDPFQIPTNYRQIVFCLSIKYGGQAEWDFAYRQYSNQTDGLTRRDLLYGLSCTKDTYLLTKFLNDRLTESYTVYSIQGMRYAALQPAGNLLTWSFVKRNWQTLRTRFPATTLYSLTSDIASKFTSEYDYKDYVSFFAENPFQNLNNTNSAFARSIRGNIKWYTDASVSIDRWFRDFNNQTVTQERIDYRLPQDLKPSRYELQIQPYIGPNYGNKSFTSDAVMKMHFTCVNPTSVIIFHALNMVIDGNGLVLSSTTDSGITVSTSYRLDPIRDFVIVDMSRPCQRNAQYSLTVPYVGEIRSALNGFYRSSYRDPATGTTRYLAVTDFEPADARRAFPCFDEPAMKAEFLLTIIAPKTFTGVFGNQPIESTTDWPVDNAWKVVKFKLMPPLSTYLIAFAVSEFPVISKRTEQNNILVEVAARPQAIQDLEGDHALNVTSLIMDHFIDYFNVNYTLEKSTQISIPDFSSGAMENWGLITYGESSLLYNPVSGTIANKHRVTLVVAHELAHQWFGNIVSPKWWNDLWLNEGFASWVEYLGLNHTNPEWLDVDYFYSGILSTIVTDSLETSHPLSVDVFSPPQIGSIFDTITYDKGSAIVRMMSFFLGEDTFRKGLTEYLKRFSYGNAAQDDLFDELTKQARLDGKLDASVTVKDILDPWTLQKGYPVVTVTTDPAQGRITLNQQWFLLNPLNKMQLPQNLAEYKRYQWFVPFTFTTSKQKNFVFETQYTWLKPNDTNLVIPVSNYDANTWIIGNLKHSGYYRVNYDANNWRLLANQLATDHEQIDFVNRAQLIGDSFNLGRAGYLRQDVFLSIAKYLEKEQVSLPFITAISGLNYVGNLISGNFDTFSSFKQFYTTLMLNTYQRLAWKPVPEDFYQVDLQVNAISIMCTYGYKDCVDKSRDLYNNAATTPISNTLKATVYSTVIRYGTEDDWFKMYDQGMRTADPTEKLRLIRALTSSRELGLLDLILKRSLNETVVRLGDLPSFITSVASNAYGRDLAQKFVESNWNYLYEKFAASTLASLLSNMFGRYNTRYELERVDDFSRKYANKLGGAETAIKNAIETINTNIYWMDNNLEAVDKWLKDNVAFMKVRSSDFIDQSESRGLAFDADIY